MATSPPIHLPYIPGDSRNAELDNLLSSREDTIRMLKFHLKRAQHRMTQVANKKRTDRSFVIGDLVLLKLQPYRQHTLRKHKEQKLSPKYFGPYRVVDKIGNFAYRLEAE